MLSEQPTRVTRDNVIKKRNLVISIHPPVRIGGDLDQKYTQLNYRATVYNACEDSRNHGQSYLNHNEYGYFRGGYNP